MITIPRWLLFLVAVWVIAFGLFRLYVARQRKKAKDEPNRPNFRQKGFYAQSPRRHVAFGALYLLMGAVLVAMGFGWQPPILGTGCDGGGEAEEAPSSTIDVERVD